MQSESQPTYTELLDAEVVKESDNAYKFMFGESDACWVPKKTSKVVDGKIYVERWIALKKQAQWDGVMIPGSGGKLMRASTKREQTVAYAITLMEELSEQIIPKLTGIRVTLDAIQKLDKEDKELDEATTKIMGAINKEQ